MFRNAALLSVASLLVALSAGGCDYKMNDHERGFIRALGTATITVYPAYLRLGAEGEHHGGSAERLAKFLIDDKLATATVSAEQPPLAAKWQMNQSKMFLESLASFQTYIREHPVNTDYAIMAEYLKGGRTGNAGGVHVYIVDKEGREALAFLSNDHFAEFSSRPSVTPEECCEIAIAGIKKHIQERKELDRKDKQRAE
ncbi:MAG: hypothetical protein ACKVS9_12420 [Phycisphaerae bacterium]